MSRRATDLLLLQLSLSRNEPLLVSRRAPGSGTVGQMLQRVSSAGIRIPKLDPCNDPQMNRIRPVDDPKGST